MAVLTSDDRKVELEVEPRDGRIGEKKLRDRALHVLVRRVGDLLAAAL
jgi:hypothetical protein